MGARRRVGHALCPGGPGMTWRAGFAVFLLLFASAFDGVDAASANNVDQGLAADTVGDYARALTRYRKLAAQGTRGATIPWPYV